MVTEIEENIQDEGDDYKGGGEEDVSDLVLGVVDFYFESDQKWCCKFLSIFWLMDHHRLKNDASSNNLSQRKHQWIRLINM